MNQQRFNGMMGFCMRAGKITLGTESVVSAMALKETRRPKLIIICSEASPATQKMLITKSEYYGIDYMVVDITPSRLGDLLGKSFAPVCAAINDENFAREIAKAVNDSQG